MWLTIEEVCDRLQVSRSTYEKWRARGVAPRARRMPNGRVLTKATDVEQWLEELPEAA